LGKIFRGHNLVEYKSYQASLSVEAFYKVIAYTYFYKSLDKTVDIKDVTITFIGKRRPKKLLKYLEEEQGFTVAEDESGIYTISGHHIPIQIIATRSLSEENSIYLSGLSRNLRADRLKSIIEAVSEEQNAKSDAYLYLILQANMAALEGVKAMGRRKFEEKLEELGYVSKRKSEQALQEESTKWQEESARWQRQLQEESARWQRQLQEESAKWQNIANENAQLRLQVAELQTKQSSI
jgi:uncharacterized protein YqjF (DUF2071 family)